MRISDWSSDVCSSDLGVAAIHAEQPLVGAIRGWLVEDNAGWQHLRMAFQLVAQCFTDIRHLPEVSAVAVVYPFHYLMRAEALLAENLDKEALQTDTELGRPSCRERGCQYGENSVVPG